MAIRAVSGLSLFTEQPRTLVILVIHYSEYGEVTPHLFALMQSGLDMNASCVLVSSYLDEKSLLEASRLPLLVLERENKGYDFGSLKESYLFLRDRDLLSDCRRLVVVNNSMLQVGKASFSASPGLSTLLDSSLDVQSITDSYQTGLYHLQSYHFSLSHRALFSSAFLHFLLTYDHESQSRDYAVRFGEIRMTQCLLRSDLSVGAWLPISLLSSPRSFDLISRAVSNLTETYPLYFGANQSTLDKFCAEWLPRDLTDYNPSIHGWALLILLGYPFMKRQLFELGDLTTAPALYSLISEMMTFDIKESEVSMMPKALRLPVAPEFAIIKKDLPVLGPAPIV